MLLAALMRVSPHWAPSPDLFQCKLQHEFVAKLLFQYAMHPRALISWFVMQAPRCSAPRVLKQPSAKSYFVHLHATLTNTSAANATQLSCAACHEAHGHLHGKGDAAQRLPFQLHSDDCIISSASMQLISNFSYKRGPKDHSFGFRDSLSWWTFYSCRMWPSEPYKAMTKFTMGWLPLPLLILKYMQTSFRTSEGYGLLLLMR